MSSFVGKLSRIMMLAVIFAVSLATTACEDEKCKTDLASSKATAEQAQTDLKAARAEAESLKAKAAQAEALAAKVEALTKEKEGTQGGAANPLAAPEGPGDKKPAAKK